MQGLLRSQNRVDGDGFLPAALMPLRVLDHDQLSGGLSRLHAWRFAVATLAGIIPASFLLAHFGGEAVSGRPSGARHGRCSDSGL